jgi:hypothetical protein
MPSVQVELAPAQSPFQPAKSELFAGVGVSVSVSPATKA